MIGQLTGTVISNIKNPILILVGDIGLLVTVPPSLIKSFQPNTKYTLFTHLVVKDDALDLYGFQIQEDLDMFTMLITVSGIGPKTAIHIVDRGAKAINTAISTADVEFFTTIPRLGRKNAQKIIIELKSKLSSLIDLDLTNDEKGSTGDLVDALISMGFGRQEILTVIRKYPGSDKPFENRLREILKLLGKK